MQQFNEQHPHRGDWLREIVFGLNDGLVTTLVFIMAVSEVASTRLLMVALGGYLSAHGRGSSPLQERQQIFQLKRLAQDSDIG